MERERVLSMVSLGEKGVFSMANLFLADQIDQAVKGKTNFQRM